MSYFKLPCPRCGAPVVNVTVDIDGTHRTVAMDPSVPIYERLHDYEARTGFWHVFAAPRGEEKWVMAGHVCRGQAAGGAQWGS